ncbi:CoB--CoM heterodisulfide reductase iron-sulfur subunit A family protein, partial [bacterium]
MERIGVFICWCGSNIAGTVNVNELVDLLLEVPGVAHAQNYMYMCSDPGQELIRNAIREKELNRVVVASCSPRMHEKTFRKAAHSVGLNPFLVEIANIREQCSWVHQGDKAAATQKAMNIILATIGKVRKNAALESIRVPLTRRALVVGAGVAGMTAAIELGEAGYETFLVERETEVGGKLRHLSKTFPFHESASEILKAKADALAKNENVRLMTNCELKDVTGYVGNFDVTLRSNYDGSETKERIGAIVLANGYDLYPVKAMGEYGAGEVEDVVDSLTFERLLKESMEAGAPVKRPSDGRAVESAVFIQCSGSRDPAHHKPYCSRVCCLYTSKQSKLLCQQNSGAKAIVSYMDIRTDIKLCEEYCQENIDSEGILYVRGRVSKLWREGDKVALWTADTLSGEKILIEADIVVLAQAIVPSRGSAELAQVVRASADQNGFLQESH